MQATAPILRFTDLGVRFGPIETVRSVSFVLHAAETAALVGASGSGKSQAMLAAMGLLQASAQLTGSVRFGAEELIGAPRRRLDRIRGRDIAMIFQEPMSALDPLFPVGTQIAAVLRLKMGLRRRAARNRAIELIDGVGIGEAQRRARAYPHELSGGQRQRIAIAMAMACEPKVLIADEPTTALDVTVEARILDLLADLKRALGLAMIFISHDLGLVRQLADSIHVMNAGTIVESGASADVIASPQHAVTRHLLSLSPPAHKRNEAPSPVLLDAQDVKVAFDLRGGLLARRRTIHAVDGVSLLLRKGRTIGLVGESGSGKSTLGRALLRLVPASGRISFEDRDLMSCDTRRMRPLRRSLQLVFQDPYSALSPRLRVGEIVTEGLRVHAPAMTKAERDAAAIHALEEVRLDPATRHRFPHEFSGGQRQRIAIARAMILKPRLVVLDEPTSALDRAVQTEIIALLAGLQEMHDLAYVFISHDLTMVQAIADEIAVMKDGRIVELGPADAILNRPREDYTRLLIEAAARKALV